MTGLEVVSFLGLAILANTVFPMPFEPILVAFSGGIGREAMALLCLVGSVCAGLAALVDAGCLGVVRRRLNRRLPPLDEDRATFRFYAFTAAAALLPIPFTLVRAALLHTRPQPFLFAGIVAVARYPRYLVTVFAWGALALPEWAGWVAAGLTVLAALEWRHATRRRRPRAPGSAAAGASPLTP
jgi:membrane protein YqaA with SNARE-associated domain